MTRRTEYDDEKTRLRRYHDAWELVQKQADDDGLWFCAENISEAYLQQELRKLHSIIEGEEND